MSMYGCCLRGINPWVVVISLLIFLAATTFLVFFMIRRLSPLVRRRLTRHKKDEKHVGGVAARLKDWFVKRKPRRRETTPEFSMGLLDPEQRDDEEV